MKFSYQITPQLLHNLVQFYRLYERFDVLKNYPFWQKKLFKVVENEISKASVTIDTSESNFWSMDTSIKLIAKALSQNKIDDFKHYRHTVSTLKDYTHPSKLSLSIINKIHKSVLGGSSTYRIKERLIKKMVIDKYIQSNIDVHILIPKPTTSTPDQLEEVIDLYHKHKQSIDSFLMAGLMHLHLVLIHPFEEGNGRLARIIEKVVLSELGENHHILMNEDYYLRHREMYYDVIAQSIENMDATVWLEFYTKALHYGIRQSADILYNLSGSTIDIVQKKYVQISEREKEVISYLNNIKFASAADLARHMNIARQTAHAFLTHLVKKDIVEKVGRNTNIRYMIKTNLYAKKQAYRVL